MANNEIIRYANVTYEEAERIEYSMDLDVNGYDPSVFLLIRWPETIVFQLQGCFLCLKWGVTAQIQTTSQLQISSRNGLRFVMVIISDNYSAFKCLNSADKNVNDLALVI